MFTDHFMDYDIIALQEVWACCTDNHKESLLCYAHKAGFIYYATQDCADPLFNSLYVCDSGLVILSRFPILKSDYIPFSLGFGSDSEAKRGCLYAQI
jgi:endonuclease/exonuclease/phosphatase family metal-dependent hydrolase